MSVSSAPAIPINAVIDSWTVIGPTARLQWSADADPDRWEVVAFNEPHEPSGTWSSPDPVWSLAVEYTQNPDATAREANFTAADFADPATGYAYLRYWVGSTASDWIASGNFT